MTYLPPLLPTKPFNLDAALKGAPFIHRADAQLADCWSRVSTTLMKVEHPEHPAYIAYCGEWLVYDINRGELKDLEQDLLLVEPQGREVAA